MLVITWTFFMWINNTWYLLVRVLSPQSVVYCHGGRIGFYQGDIRLLPDDMKALRPTIFPVVPRLLNRMYDKVRWACEGSLRCQPRPFWVMFWLFEVSGAAGWSVSNFIFNCKITGIHPKAILMFPADLQPSEHTAEALAAQLCR